MERSNLQARLFLLAIASLPWLVVHADAQNKYNVIHHFVDTPASSPESSLVADASGNLYGPAAQSAPDACGDFGCGAIFSLSKQSGGKWAYRVIHRFKKKGGWFPVGGLIFDGAGNLYGTTYQGGAYGFGTVFELSPVGDLWKEQVLYSFHGAPDVADPGGALTFDKSGNLYGAAPLGGPKKAGGVFKLSPSGKRWRESLIYAFTGGTDGEWPAGNLSWDSAGSLYGIAGGGGTSKQGVVFQLSPSSGKTWKEAVLHNFTGGSDGGTPIGGVISDTQSNLYGMTNVGGISSCGQGYGCGTVFELQPAMGKWKFSVLHAFDINDGGDPFDVLTMDSAGDLYGTTYIGGAQDYGTVFELSSSGGKWSETVIHSFDPAGEGGSLPLGGVIVDSEGVIYGTAAFGGVGDPGYGVVFSITP